MREGHLSQMEAEAVEEAVQHEEHEEQNEDPQVVHRDHALICDVLQRPRRRHHRLHRVSLMQVFCHLWCGECSGVFNPVIPGVGKRLGQAFDVQLLDYCLQHAKTGAAHSDCFGW